MLSQMQDRPLLISSLIEHAAAFHGRTAIVSRQSDGSVERTNWHTVRDNAKRVANGLGALSIGHSDRVATLAWNTRRHLELYCGVSGAGCVLHTVNPRLTPEHIAYVINHAEDQVLFYDPMFAALVEKLAPSLATVRTYVVLCNRNQMPKTNVPEALSYDEWIAKQSADYSWPEFDEREASSLCYTSGTTGLPKGVLYSHRSTILHALAEIAPDAFGLGASETVMLIVPMFHVNAWGTPYAAAICGCSLILPGPFLDGKNVYETMRSEKVTISQGVPTIWLMLFQYLDEHPDIDPAELDLKLVGIGGSALPRAMLERLETQFGVEVIQGWGMTETSPLGAVNKLLPWQDTLSKEEQTQIKLKQGRGVWGVEMKLTDEEGREQPWDGRSRGHLMVRGPWVVRSYFGRDDERLLDETGFFPTGDIATIDADGFLQLVDRAKDVIKSGGEWISSIDLENAAMSHPGVAEAAVIGVHHSKWQERPLMIVVRRSGHEFDKNVLLDFLAGRVAKWWLLDDVLFVADLPHSGTGKLLKSQLREQFKSHRLPTD